MISKTNIITPHRNISRNDDLLLPVLLHPYPSYHHDQAHHFSHKWLYGKPQAMLALPIVHVQTPERSHLLPSISDLNDNIKLLSFRSTKVSHILHNINLTKIAMVRCL
jgi:hypothetical protein